MQKKIKDQLLIFIKGFVMGLADIMPGVSGGTMALITGIYQRLIGSISAIELNFIPLALKGNFKAAKKSFLKIDFPFFIPLAFGIGLAVFSMAHLIEFLLDSHTGVTYSFFFGLILASAILIFNEVKGFTPKDLTPAVIGFLIAFAFSGFSGSAAFSLGNSLPVIFISGLIAICAMILPGISGAFLLLLLGQYEFVISAIKDLNLVVIAVFGIGALIGILSFSRVLNLLLSKHRTATIYFLVGLMLGALRLPYIQITSSNDSLLLMLVTAILGLGLIIFFERKLGRIVKK